MADRNKGNSKRTSALMVQGTCSGAGKSQLAAGLLRILSDEGIKAAPFKSQNMALNSFITEDGAEIGRAQAQQAEAARVKASSHMNPVLLKATGEQGSQVIINGRVHSNMTAKEYYAFRDEAWSAITASYARLAKEYDLIVIEGAGSPAEINLSEQEVVNMRVARHARSPVLLVGDIERGGVFASFYGTHALLQEDAGLIKAYVINKFRGDVDILNPGLEMMEKKTGVPTIGVLPWLRDLGLDEEDGLALSSMSGQNGGPGPRLKVVVVRLRFISNFTDFAPLMAEPDVELAFSTNPAEIEGADLVIVPGSKNSTQDMDILNRSGLSESIQRAAKKGAHVAGICGGYQMLGQGIADPLGVEGGIKDVSGIGLLPLMTTLRGEKVTSQTEATTTLFGNSAPIRGYEIHMGQSEVTGDSGGLMELKRLATGETLKDGASKGNVWGTYLHGIFDSNAFRSAMLNTLRHERGLALPDSPLDYQALRERNMDRWADVLREHLDMDFIRGLIG